MLIDLFYYILTKIYNLSSINNYKKIQIKPPHIIRQNGSNNLLTISNDFIN